QGAEVLKSFPQLACALPVVRYHHERWDGSGYPEGLAGEAIPLSARIFAIADTLEAMSSNRPYRRALPFSTIRDEIARLAGSHFDPSLVSAFLNVPEEEWEELSAKETANIATVSEPKAA
ncbi:MAG TPA: HD domain-containing phosphohydrolase, partial [Chthonomonadales bacterium]|nr:HD domain-containing phosphohydrolase [Chthonomonadales bacterium]